MAILFAPMLLAFAGPSGPGPDIHPGIYTNEEQIYFVDEAGSVTAEWRAFDIDEDGTVRRLDAFGIETGAPPPDFADVQPTPLGFDMGGNDFRRARRFTCWMAIPKSEPGAGGEEFAFTRALALHDQGGMARFGGADTGAEEFVIKMRNVIWPSGPNRPSLVLYVFRAGDLSRAVSYSWADPAALRIGINLRFMQTSCTLDGAE